MIQFKKNDNIFASAIVVFCVRCKFTMKLESALLECDGICVFFITKRFAAFVNAIRTRIFLIPKLNSLEN